ncbi:hypothetical protein PAXINDRAFT_20392 [Paxillus involutus ATCC 200175]|uniref:Uncharacterized protein n=1 Tax=Paxillus involutus ATCC 200175 TaxID=664439 RepID=A0A0C9TGK3_PAXIN|nr:hypothetical protein PAXINDRAFT_20392 [Paxillus involutus ATCC 200175]
MAVHRPYIHRSHLLSSSKVSTSSTSNTAAVPLISQPSVKQPVHFNVCTISKHHCHATSSQITAKLVLPGHQHLSQCAEGPSVQHSIPFDPFSTPDDGASNFINTAQIYGDPTPLSTSALQKRQNRYCRWSQEVIPLVLKPYMWYLCLSKSLSIPVNH